jgi:hypothetical protein
MTNVISANNPMIGTADSKLMAAKPIEQLKKKEYDDSLLAAKKSNDQFNLKFK